MESKTINIYSTDRNGYEGLSNILNGPVKAIIEGKELTFKTVEHIYQIKKALFSGDRNAANRIFVSKTGWDAQREAKTIKGLCGQEWDKFSSHELEYYMRLAFEQNDDKRKLLLSTGEAILTHKSKVKLGKWESEFPRILMKLREEFKCRKA